MTTSGTSSRYGSENFAREFRDLQATTMSVDRTAQYALLAGRKYLAVISLEFPTADKLLYRLAYGGKYEISISQWSKIENSPNSVAIASSQRCDIFELSDSSELRCLHRLKGHTRVITDLDWCPLQANLLATCSFDSYVNIWDLRSPRIINTEKPQFSLSALDGASQVKWNKVEQDILASCDGGHVKIWDLRKPSSPTEYIAAHASKINGLEWASKDTIITAAQDCTVKFSRLAANNPNKTRGPVLSLTAPVWRARPAPFGRGIVTQCVPILRRDSGLLSLWDWRRFTSPVYTFQAHDIVEFAWKKNESFELLTWSRDQTLRMWTLPYEIVELCGGGDGSRPQCLLNATGDDSALETGVEMLDDDDDESPSGSPKPERPPTSLSRHAFGKKERSSSERRSRKSSSPTPLTRRDEVLMNEYDLISPDIPETITFDQVELERGLLRFSWVGKLETKGRSGVIAGVLVSFPLGYPAAAPTFLVTNASNEVDKNQILKSLRNVAQQNAKKNETCLLACINMFVSIMQSIKTLDAESASEFPTIGVSNVPFPRTSGARFCSVGMLVCFGRPSYLRRIKSNTDSGTPRSLSALGPFLSQLAHENEDGRSRRSRRLEKKKANIVTVFDVTPMLPFNRGLGEDYYHIVSNPFARKKACCENANSAKNGKKSSVAHTWQAASIVADFSNESTLNPGMQHVHDMQMADVDDDEANWISYHPLGSDLIHSMITHYAKHGDVQTAGTMACLFTTVDPSSFHVGLGVRVNNESHKSINQNKHLKPPGMGSPYHTVHGSDTLHGVIMNPITDTYSRQHRSNSWSDSLDDMKTLTTMYDGLASGGMNSGFMSQQGGIMHISDTSSGLGPSNGNTSMSSLMNGRGSHHLQISYSNGSISKDLDMTMSLSMDGNCGSSSTDEKPLLPIPRGYILNPGLNSLYDCYKKSYAEILYRWGLLQQRAEVLKTLTLITENHMIIRAGVDFSIECRHCHQVVKGPFCQQCKRVASICAICHLPARGLSTFCSACGHGGHSAHMLSWFKNKTMCATGCGCHCIEENTRVFK
ncbi:WD repeat-containing protein 59 [Orchesella cincta]|uniref:WD repeat-containing protein 59 n=1 Tax=Orchesella cincta TaxID=48709 RepID=A0A1D2N6M2_ORCCI|nr:WD repeat-containing protein 59 [Orchesella cincta]